MPVVWVVGSLNVDLVFRMPHLPEPGETVQGSNFSRFPGGKGANQAVAAARAGATVRMIGRVGDDAIGAEYLAGLRGLSVDIEGVAIENDCATGQAAVLVDDRGENCIVVTAGANGCVDRRDVARLQPARDDVVLLQLEVSTEVTAQSLTIARRAGAHCMVNLAPYRDADARLIRRGDVVVVNEHEARQMAAAALAPDELVITQGSRGASWGARTAACSAETVIDTTGAGDAFTGTLAAGLAAGLEQQAALQLAVDAGAAAVARRGAQGWAFG